MQLEGNVLLIICLVPVLGLALPVGLYLGLRGGRGTVGQIELFRKAVGALGTPWGEEDKELDKLSERVGKLQNPEE